MMCSSSSSGRNDLLGFEEIAEDIGEVEDRFARALGFAGNDAVQRVQCVEEKMRMDLRLKRAQLGLGHQSAQFPIRDIAPFVRQFARQRGPAPEGPHSDNGVRRTGVRAAREWARRGMRSGTIASTPFCSRPARCTGKL